MATETQNGPAQSFEESKAAGYEIRDASIRGLVGFAIGMAVVLFIITVAMIWTFRYYAHTQTLGPTASPFENSRTIPPLPRLQAAPHTDILEYWQSQQQALNGYGWVDRQKGIVHIPIDQAMGTVVQRGLPARAANETKPNSEPTEVPTAPASAAGSSPGASQ